MEIKVNDDEKTISQTRRKTIMEHLKILTQLVELHSMQTHIQKRINKLNVRKMKIEAKEKKKTKK